MVTESARHEVRLHWFLPRSLCSTPSGRQSRVRSVRYLSLAFVLYLTRFKLTKVSTLFSYQHYFVINNNNFILFVLYTILFNNRIINEHYGRE